MDIRRLPRSFLECGGANISDSSSGFTALTIAARRKKCHCIVPTLLKHGSNVNPILKSSFRDSLPLLAACRCKDSSKPVQQLLEEEHGEDTNAADSRGRSAIHVTAADSDEETVQILIAHGANVNHRNPTNHDSSLLEAAGPSFGAPTSQRCKPLTMQMYYAHTYSLSRMLPRLTQTVITHCMSCRDKLAAD